MVDVSIIIVNLNTRDLLRACLRSVFSETSTISYEVIVIDNASSDGSVEMVRTEFPAVRLFANTTNEGFARPNNEGMARATGKYLFLLNSDTLVKPNAIATLASFLDAHADVGACGPMLLYPDGTLQYSVKGFPTVWTHCCDMLLLDKVFPRTRMFGRGEMKYFAYTETHSVDHVMAAAFMVRREVLSSAGMFDERFRIYYNDMDWCFRIIRQGWKIYYVHDAQVVHYLGQTVNALNTQFDYFEELYDNVIFFYQKHYGRASVIAYKLLLVAGFLLRTPAWGIYRVLKPSPRSVHMAQFCRKSLAFGLRFWRPVPRS